MSENCAERPGRQYTKLDEARALIDPIIHGIANEGDKRGAFVHLYGTGLLAAVFALKRGFSRETAELCEITGILHDLLTYVDPDEDGLDHAPKCADFAKEKVLDKLKGFTEEEKTLIYNGVKNHSDKRTKGSDFDEIIKDADAAHHALRNPMEDLFFDMPRIRRTVEELTE